MKQLFRATITNAADAFDVVRVIALQRFRFQKRAWCWQTCQLCELFEVHLLVLGIFTQAYPAHILANQLEPVAIARQQVDVIDGRLRSQARDQHSSQVVRFCVLCNELVNAQRGHHFQDVRLLDGKAFFHLLHIRVVIAIRFVLRVEVATFVAESIPQDHWAGMEN
ncbi:Uncharacterised protein [Enterobacter hormaechei]|nr:Uncharacterised protein [Enterobacter hormaechei]